MFIERRDEIVLYILPRAIECLGNLLIRRKLLPQLVYSDIIMFAIVMGILNYYYC